jgi:hypothetical protein
MDNNITTTASTTIEFEDTVNNRTYEARILYGIDGRDYGDGNFDYDCEVQKLTETDEDGFVTIWFDGTFTPSEFAIDLMEEIEAFFISNYFDTIVNLMGNEFNGTTDRNDA